MDENVQPPSVQVEAALLSRAAGGDEAAVAALYDAYARPLWAFGLRRLGDPELAGELVQRVMTRLWQSAGRYDPSRASVRSYVFTIARTAVVDLHRQRARQPQPSADAEDVASGVAAIDELDALLQAEVVRAALDRLSSDHRQMLDLAYFRGLTQVEIAGCLELPLGTVKSRTYYALKALRLACDELGVNQ
ncbi:MAG: sigma-70 family RNA polymerase sigma factor [Actinomycetota bacterium]|nr:sigma-70 family RNA polymerase sigma factor [Actinomycetota bacterium]